MVESQNTKVDFKTKANFLGGLTSRGDLLVGNKAIEYYNERNVRDFIQIPYTEIKLVTASVIFKKKINKYLPDDKLRRSLTVWDYVKRKFKK